MYALMQVGCNCIILCNFCLFFIGSYRWTASLLPLVLLYVIGYFVYPKHTVHCTDCKTLVLILKIKDEFVLENG